MSNKTRTYTFMYTFMYNLPAELHVQGKSDHYIPCSAEWEKDKFYPTSGKPVVMKEGPVMVKLTHYDLMVVKHWPSVFNDIERIASEYFADTFNIEPKTCVEIAEEILR